MQEFHVAVRKVYIYVITRAIYRIYEIKFKVEFQPSHMR